MIDPGDLERIIQLRDRLKVLMTFKRGAFDANRPWRGLVEVSFGGYEAKLSMDILAVSGAVLRAIQAEESALRSTLDAFGVDHSGIV